MKYSKKQIRKAFQMWLSEQRVTPSGFMSDEDVNAMDAKHLAKLNAEALIDYIIENEL